MRRARGVHLGGTLAPSVATLLAACAGDVGTAETDSADVAPACFVDADRDGHGDPARPAEACGGTTATTGDDCDDADPGVHPDAIEACDGVDGDCDGLLDDADTVADPLPWYADADGDGYGTDTLVYACALGPGAATRTGDCDDADPTVHPDAVEACDAVDQDCDGAAGDALGVTAECAAASCLEILAANPTAADGAWWLALPSGATAEVTCDMSGGGWTLGFLRTSASAGSNVGFGAGEQSLGDLAADPAEASASPVGRLGWLDLNAMAWTDLRLAAWYAGALTYTSRDVPRTELRIPFGADGYLLYGGASGYWWCGGAASYTDAGVGATDNPAGAPADCKGHGSLGSGWDFSESPTVNQGLTLCGPDASSWMFAAWASTYVYYGNAGAAQAIWVR